MKFSCEQCHAQYFLEDSKIGPDGVRVACRNCDSVIVVQASVELDESTSVEDSETESASAVGIQLDKVFDSVFEGASAGGEAATANPQDLVVESMALRDAEPKIWYVAIGDVQVGPMDVQEVTERFNIGDIDEETLTWKAGMQDWAPLGSLADFNQFKEDLGAEQGELEQEANPSSVIEPKSLGRSQVEPAAISWEPSAATELAALVEEELTGLSASLPESSGDSDSSSSLEDTRVPVEGDGRRIPTFRTPKPKGASGLISVMVGLGLLGLIGAAGWVFMPIEGKPTSPTLVEAPTPKVVTEPPTIPPALVKVEEPSSEVVVKPVPKEVSKPLPKVVKKKKRPKPKARKKKPKVKRVKPKPASNSIDRVFEAKVKVKARLAKQDIVDGVRTNAKNVRVCLEKARKKGEVVPGTHKLTLEWTIRADGSVTQPKLKGPANFLGTSLPACFQKKMREWRFPASKQGAPIRNYPFGPFTVR